MRRKEMKYLLEERAERITLLESRMETQNQLIDGYRARELAVIESLSSAAEAAKRRVADAETRAQTILKNAQERAASAVAAAEKYAADLSNKAESDAGTAKRRISGAEAQAQTILQNAQESAASTVATAEKYAADLSSKAASDAETLVADARLACDEARRQAEEEAKAAYQRADTLNRAVDRRAKELAALAEEFLGMVGGAHLDPEQPLSEAPALAKYASETKDAPAPALTGALQDAGNNPALVMQNIYRLQQRDIADTVRAEAPKDKAPAAEKITAEEFFTQKFSAEKFSAEKFSAEKPAAAGSAAVGSAAAGSAAASWAAEEKEEAFEDLAASPMENTEDGMPREFDDGEAPVKEWSPEVEPEAEIPDVPRVSDMLPDEPAQTDDDLSLEALLDEIIRAGE